MLRIDSQVYGFSFDSTALVYKQFKRLGVFRIWLLISSLNSFLVLLI